jgi:integrase
VALRMPGRASCQDDLPAAVKCFQFRDLRAKAGTDKADATDMREAQQQPGHKSVKTTEIYLRARAGEKVTPTK